MIKKKTNLLGIEEKRFMFIWLITLKSSCDCCNRCAMVSI